MPLSGGCNLTGPHRTTPARRSWWTSPGARRTPARRHLRALLFRSRL